MRKPNAASSVLNPPGRMLYYDSVALMMTTPIYLDYAATTPVDERVLAAMQPYHSAAFGNPSPIHRFGQQAEAAIDAARETVASALGCQPDEIYFTSGGSESDNLAVRGAALAARERTGANRVVTSRAEHPAVSKTTQQLADHFGFETAWLPVDADGTAGVHAVEDAITPGTAVVSVMYANNEIGTVNPIHEIADLCRRRGVVFHTDAVQAAAYLPVDVRILGVDLLSIGGHKFYGPKGVGALYVRKGTPLIPVQTGGSQERGLRAGTHSVAQIVGFAKALDLAVQERVERTSHVQPLRDRIVGTVLEAIADSRLTGSPRVRLPNHVSFAFRAVDGNLLLTLLDAAGFACSSGSACKTGNPEPSEVMTAIGLPADWGLGSLRVTLGNQTTSEDVEAFLEILPPAIEKARGLARH